MDIFENKYFEKLLFLIKKFLIVFCILFFFQIIIFFLINSILR